MGSRVPTPVQETDFRLFVIGDEPQTKLSIAAQKWLNERQIKQNIEELIATADIEFTSKLFSHSRVVGVLQCGVTTQYETDTEWLLLANTTSVRSHDISLCRVVSSKRGEFLFLPVSRFVTFDAHRLDFQSVQFSATQRFFIFFGGLRISMPHLGGTHFRRTPTPCAPEMIASKFGQSRWMGASIFYVVDYRNYFILSEQGEVGYVPIDPDQPIQHYARDFESFLEMWLRELYQTDV